MSSITPRVLPKPSEASCRILEVLSSITPRILPKLSEAIMSSIPPRLLRSR